jgi:hypothetical protein
MPLISGSTVPVVGASVSIAIPASGLLSVDVEPQVQSKWCWAAVGSALTRFYPGAALSQHEVASRVLAQDCTAANAGACNVGTTMGAVLRKLRFEDGQANIVALEAIATRIAAGRPVVIRVARVTGPSHFVLVKGYARGPRLIEVDDPDGGATQTISYDAFVHGQVTLGTWTDTFWTKPVGA